MNRYCIALIALCILTLSGSSVAAQQPNTSELRLVVVDETDDVVGELARALALDPDLSKRETKFNRRIERVRGDYRTRLAALEEEARPHKERARREFAKLQALESEIRQGRDAVRLEKEELEFRHSLGEFPDEDFERRGAELAEAVDHLTEAGVIAGDIEVHDYYTDNDCPL